MAAYDTTIYLIRVGAYILAVLFLLERHILPSSTVKKSISGLEQPRLNLEEGEMVNLLDPKTGRL